MALTRSWEQSPAVLTPPLERAPLERRREFPFLLATSLLVAAGLALVFFSKTQNFPGFAARSPAGELLDLNSVQSAAEISPFLQNFTDQAERDLAAQNVFDFLSRVRPIPNVGALARLRISQSEIESESRWNSLRGDLQRRLGRLAGKSARLELRIPLLPLARLKPSLVVRTPAQFTYQYVLWCGIYLASFWVLHVLWRLRRFRGDPVILPALQLLTGVGLILAVSLRDPLRDSLDFRKFAWGSAAGCLLLLLPLLRAFQVRHFSRWVYTPLLLSFLLFALLLAKGSGPTGSDAKVNLGPFQPVELIKVLLVLFLAGYFSRRWEWLRELREKRLVPAWLRWPEIPRLEHVIPVIVGVAIALALFFVLKDMGPALVIGFLFLSMFAMARGRFGLALLGIFLLVAGVSLGYHLGAPQTVVDRIDMWLSPWDNNLRGGDQIAHSLWALSTGGPWGSGPGMGDPGMIPAGHTDLVLSSIGEEWGILGGFTIFTLFVVLIHRAFRIARNAPDEYSAFLSFGLGSLVAFEMLLISGGVLDLIPLSGVVSPFLSSGNTAMLANFLIFAILLGISNHGRIERLAGERVFQRPIRVTGAVLAALALILLGRMAYLQVVAPDRFLVHDAKVIAEDGVKRPQHNPRLSSLMQQIPRGAIYDRNGVLLASSSWSQLEGNRAAFQKLGIDLDQCCSRLEGRHYPFGPLTVQLLGDFRTGENFHATNASLIEHDSNAHLQGYSDIAELAPAVRYRHYPHDPRMRALLDRDRDLKTSLDIRLQMALSEIVRRSMEAAGTKGAAIVLDPASGDVLAMVSAPHPEAGRAAVPDELLDRARYGQYPPGSTFKLVTAMAALRVSPDSTRQTYACRRLPDGRSGTIIRGWNRPIRDDIKDHPHGVLDMFRAITVSCNAYFAQLGVFNVGAAALRQTTELLELSPGDPVNFKQMLPFSSYGQGPVLTTPFKMARVAATIADGGAMPQGRWVIDGGNARVDAPRVIVNPEAARFLGSAMRSVVTSGTGRQAMDGLDIPVAGKTGTAQVEQGEPHSWFAGFAPYGDSGGPRIAFAVVVEHGGYGSRAAAPVARELIEAARDLGIITPRR